MFRAMALKELRETRGIVLLAMVVYALVVAGEAFEWQFDNLENWWCNSNTSNSLNDIYPGPFLAASPIRCYWWFTLVLAAALGLWQTLGESIHGAWPFLLHRLASRRWLIGMKLLVGLGLYFVCGAAVIVAFGVRSSMRGAYAAPFFWWMTAPWWEILWMMTAVYLAAFLVGIRPARWYGTRLLPLVALLFVFCSSSEATPFWLPRFDSPAWLPIFTLLVDALFVRAIFYVVRTRDYA